MRKVPKREGKKAAVALCAFLVTSACSQPIKKSAPSPPAMPSSSEQQTSTPPVTEPTYSGPLRLHEVRVIESSGQHSVLFRLSRPPEGIDYFPLRNPSRLVIDIKGAAEPPPKVQHYKAVDSLIAAVRVGNYQGRLRLVVDLKDGEPPSFSVDNYDTLITAFIGEKREKPNGEGQASNAQVLFLADEAKEASRAQLASAMHPPSPAVTEKAPPVSTSPAENSPVDSSTAPTHEATVPETTLSQSPATSVPPSATPDTTDTTTTSDSDDIQEETLSPSSPPTKFAAHLTETTLPTEEEPWEVKRIPQAPTSGAHEEQQAEEKETEDELLLARDETGAPAAAEFRADQIQQYTGKKISLDFKNADIHDVLRIIAEVSGLNIVATDDVKARVTLRLVEIPWDQALDVVLQANGLEKSQTGNVITVSTTRRLEAERNARLAAQTAQQKITPLATEYMKVNYVKATDVAALITREAQQRAASAGAGTAAAPRASAAAGRAPAGGRGQQVALMSPRGTIAADSTTNVLILRDLPENIVAVRELIRNIDVQTPQVVIESQIVSVDVTALRDLGIQWGYSYRASPETGNPTGVNFPGRLSLGPLGGDFPFIADFPASLTPGSASGLDLSLGSLDGSQALNVRLSALETKGKARVISRPHVVTLNNKPAKIHSLTEVRVPVTAGSLSIVGQGGQAGGGGAFEEFEVGLTLKVTPQISSDGFVLLDIEVESSELTGSSSAPPSGSSATPVISDVLSRAATSNVLIRASDTFVLGGIRQDRLIQREAGIPYLRDTPGLGWLFRGRSNQNVEQELVVFLTPKLVAGVSTAALPTAQQLWENRPKDNTPQATGQP